LHCSEVGSKDTDVKKVVISAAIAVVTFSIIAAGGTRTKGPAVAPAASKPSLLTTTTSAPPVGPRRPTSSAPARTVPARRGAQPTPSIGHAATKPAGTTGPQPNASLTTATSNAAQVAALWAVALQACLELAAVNNARVIGANHAWYQRQLSYLTAHHMLAGGHYQAFQIEQNQAQLEIQAQYAIDQSNCYLKYSLAH
jgi:hypothetical protein